MAPLQALLTIVAAATLLAGSADPARAKRPDCDAARSAVQAQLDTACPCTAAESHGHYVRCVARKLRALSGCEIGEDGSRACGPVPRACVGKIRRAASRSTCGEDDSVPCCLPRQRDCVGDPSPGDGTAEGTCSGSDRPCDQLTECVLPKCQIAANARHCRLSGGKPGRGRHCASACRE